MSNIGKCLEKVQDKGNSNKGKNNEGKNAVLERVLWTDLPGKFALHKDVRELNHREI